MASDLFNNAIVTTSGILTECEFCGRTCFYDDERAGDWEPGELEHYRELAKREPDKYHAMKVIQRGVFDGKEGVIGCPCVWDANAEVFIWNNRKLIMKYISARVKEVVESVLKDEGAAEHAQSDVNLEEKVGKKVRCSKCLKFVSELAMTDTGICIHCQERISKTIREQQKIKKMEKEDSWPDSKPVSMAED